MKIFIKCFVIIFVIAMILDQISTKTMKYKIEYDTLDCVDFFGNGEYQVINVSKDGYTLVDWQGDNTGISILHNVANYLEKDTNVYFMGYEWDDINKCTYKVYIVLDFVNDNIKYYAVDYPFKETLLNKFSKEGNKIKFINDFNEFSADEQLILNAL